MCICLNSGGSLSGQRTHKEVRMEIGPTTLIGRTCRHQNQTWFVAYLEICPFFQRAWDIVGWQQFGHISAQFHNKHMPWLHGNNCIGSVITQALSRPMFRACGKYAAIRYMIELSEAFTVQPSCLLFCPVNHLIISPFYLMTCLEILTLV